MHTVGHIEDLFFYPVKGLSGQRLQSVHVTPETGFPLDRFFALARADGAYRETRDRPLPPDQFYVLTHRPRLAGLETRLDPVSRRFTARVGGHVVLDCDIDTESGVLEVEELFTSVLDLAEGHRPILARSAGGEFNHNWTAYVSQDLDQETPRPQGFSAQEMMWACHLVNLASVRDLSGRLGVDVDPRRFRANIYADLGEPWVEREWMGRVITAGAVGLRVAMSAVRCSATEVNVTTGRRDLPVVRLLQRHFGHTTMGVYASFTSSGVLRPGDLIQIDSSVADSHAAGSRRTASPPPDKAGAQG